jgi:hypothetical protein
MVYRKGELSRAQVDREWPHQVAVPESTSVGTGHKVTHDFCKEQNLSLCARGHAFKGDRGEWWVVFCFAEREHAERFKSRFRGRWYDPKKRVLR